MFYKGTKQLCCVFCFLFLLLGKNIILFLFFLAKMGKKGRYSALLCFCSGKCLNLTEQVRVRERAPIILIYSEIKIHECVEIWDYRLAFLCMNFAYQLELGQWKSMEVNYAWERCKPLSHFHLFGTYYYISGSNMYLWAKISSYLCFLRLFFFLVVGRESFPWLFSDAHW